MLTQQSAAEQGYLTKIEHLEKLRDYYKDEPKKAEEVQNEITALESKLLGVRAKNYLEFIKFKKEKLDEYTQKELEVAALLAEASQDEATARINLQKTASELGAAQSGNHLAAVTEAMRLEREKLLKDKNYASERLSKEKEAALKRVENEKDSAKLKTDINEAYRLKDLGLEEEYQAKMLEIGEAYKDKRRAAAKQDAIDKNPFGATIAYGISGALGIEGIDDAIDKATSKTDAIKAVYEDLGATVLDVFSAMTAATQSLLENYILTGTAGADAFKQLAASAIAGIAVQAGIKALFELAEGYAALANPFTAYLAPFHFAAAKIYGIVAGAALGTGLAIGAAGGLQGGSRGQSQSNSPDYYTSNPNTDSSNYSNINVRTTDSATRALEIKLDRLSSAVEGLHRLADTVEAARPGDVLQRAIGEKRGLISKTVTDEFKTNASTKKAFQETINLK